MNEVSSFNTTRQQSAKVILDEIDRCFSNHNGNFESFMKCTNDVFKTFDGWRNKELFEFLTALKDNPDLTPAQFTRARLNANQSDLPHNPTVKRNPPGVKHQ